MTWRAGPLRSGIVLVAGALLVLLAACGVPPEVPPPAPAVAAPGGRVVPASVRIPALGVDEREVQRLGVAADGTAEVPQDFARVGWFDPSVARPGPTVLLGHVDSRSGPAVFFRLRDLRPGDLVEVGRADGSVARYAVERIEQVAKDAFPTFAVFGATPDDVVRLVTCAGDFDRGARSYTDNLVVHATRVR
ncbi:hypothetical protein GCM10023200_20300 [Actinomycetospora chlora]|uniref:Class F sortase n=1 Tax=Actinomycetospora chlora TaxID=663608 RepID=A0ABP9AUT6_9PSEU